MFGNVQILGWFAPIPTGGAPIAGLGTVNRVAKFTAPTVIGNSIIFDDGTSVGIGTITPTGILTLFGMVAGINQRWEPVAGVTEDLSGGKTTTSGLVFGIIQLIPIPLDKGVLIEAKITARKTAGAGVGAVGAVNAYIRIGMAKNIAGVVTLGVVESAFTSEDMPAMAAVLAVSGTDIAVISVGSTSNDINWSVVTKTNTI